MRARRNHYLPGDAPVSILRAVRVGGQLTCLSLLQLAGVFVLRNSRLHVRAAHTMSRLRSPHDRWRRLEHRSVRGVHVHWEVLIDPCPHEATCVSVVDALAAAARCQPPRATVATFDSALHLGFVDEQDLDDIFASLPVRYRALRPLIDGRAESGAETLLRLILRSLRCKVELQVVIDGVGRVDLLVDGWLIIECDSEEFHSGWHYQERDRLRDLASAERGYTVLRPTARLIFTEPERVRAAVHGLLSARRRLR